MKGSKTERLVSRFCAWNCKAEIVFVPMLSALGLDAGKREKQGKEPERGTEERDGSWRWLSGPPFQVIPERWMPLSLDIVFGYCRASKYHPFLLSLAKF